MVHLRSCSASRGSPYTLLNQYSIINSLAAMLRFRCHMAAPLTGLFVCLQQATYLLLVERSGGEKGMTSLELLLYNSILSLPVLVLLIFATGEVYESVPAIFTTAASHGSYFLFNLVISLFIGVLLNYSLFLCTLVNSALTTTVIGALKGVVATVSLERVTSGVLL